MPRRVLLTGGFGNVGAHTLRHLLDEGHQVTVLELESKGARTRAAALQRDHRFEVAWGDLRDAARVSEVMHQVSPDAIIHVAAVIAPLAYVRPQLAQEVNVDGTRNLVDAAVEVGTSPHLVFVSSYTVHGHRNPFRQTGLLTGDTPVAPFDNYGHHKVLGEAMVRDSGLSWTIVRLPAVAATDLTWGTKRAFTLFGFLLDPRRREHVLHASDAGLGLAHAITARDAMGRTFDLGGGDDCRVTGAQFSEIMHHARRISTFPKTAYRQSDPDVDESWYCEDWIDTAESQEILAYQRHTLDDYVRELRRAMGVRDYLIAAIFPLVRGRVLKVSPYHDKPFVPDATPMWQAVATHFGLEGDPSSPSRIG